MAIPKIMQAVHVSRAGGPDVLAVVQRPTPIPASGEVLIRVDVAGVNGHDLHQRHNGSHPIEKGETDLPGLEIAGEIVSVAPDVSRWRIGDWVCALVRGGGYAEYCTAKASLCLPFPDGFDARRAGALPETFFTVWSNVFVEAGLQSGETILIQGGASGIGTTAIQLAQAFGARAFTTAGTDDKCASCLALGADVAINHRTQHFEDVVLAETEGRGVDVVLDIVAGDYVSRELGCMATDGRLVIIGAALGTEPMVNLTPLIRKRLRVIGSVLRPRPLPYKEMVARSLHERVWPLLGSGQIDAVVDSIYPFSDAAYAHERMESRLHVGKVLLSPWISRPEIFPMPVKRASS